MAEQLKTTPLHAAHVAAGGRMVAFGGYDMPVQYREGVLAEHRWTREHAGLFDVSHMGPSFLVLDPEHRTGDPEADHAAVAAIMETMVCGDIKGLKPGQLRYTLLMNDDGGIMDDLMVGRPADPGRGGILYVIVNAGTKSADFHRIAEQAGDDAELFRADDRALLAIQGPEAAAVVAGLWPEAAAMSFMSFRHMDGPQGLAVPTGDRLRFVVARSGYTGEDGYEILVPTALAAAFWERLTADPRVKPIGLGARDSLRLEAGLPLYGHDIDATTSPIEAGLAFAVNKRRRAAADFPGAARVLRELAEGPSRVRVGLRLAAGGAPAREGATVVREFTPEAGPEVVEDGQHLGVITSGGPSPSLGGGVAMAYLPYDHREAGTKVQVMVRGRAQTAEVTPMPFHPHRYVRTPAPKV